MLFRSSPVDEPALIERAEPSENTPPIALRFMKVLETKDGLLFRAMGEVSALRVQITDLSGKRVYDSAFVKGSELSWVRVNSQNKPIANGVYLYVVSVRDHNGKTLSSDMKKLIIQK